MEKFYKRLTFGNSSHQKEFIGDIKLEKLIFKNLSQLTRELKSGDIVELELPNNLF